MRCRGRLRPYLLVLPGLAVLGTLFVAPLVQLVLVSLQRDYPGWPGYYYQAFGVENYGDALAGHRVQLARSFAYAGVATALTLLLTLPLAYVLAFRLVRCRGLLLALVVAPFLTSSLLRTLAWRQVLADDAPVARLLRWAHLLPGGRLTETPGAVVAGLTYTFLPFMLLPVLVSLERVDPRLLDAARDLHGTAWQTFRRVTLPLATPGVVAGTLLTFVPAVGDYVTADLLGSSRTTMIGNVVEAQLFRQVGEYPQAAALSFVLMAAILVLVLWYLRRFGTEELW